MAKVRWTAEAERWLEDIYEFIAEDNPRAALETVEAIYHRAQSLADFPEMGERLHLLSEACAGMTRTYLRIAETR